MTRNGKEVWKEGWEVGNVASAGPFEMSQIENWLLNVIRACHASSRHGFIRY